MEKLIVCDPCYLVASSGYLASSNQEWKEFCYWLENKKDSEFTCNYRLNGFILRKVFQDFGGGGGEAMYVTESKRVPVDSGLITIVEVPAGKDMPHHLLGQDQDGNNLYIEIDHITDANYPTIYPEEWDEADDDGLEDEEED